MNIKEFEKFKIDYGISNKDLTQILNCSSPTLIRKKNKNLFTLNDINQIAKKFKLSKNQVIEIFLS